MNGLKGFHITRTHNGSVFGHSVKFCDAAGCAGEERFLGAVPSEPKSCGCLRAGIMIEQDKLTVERCDDCALFEDDSAAAVAVDELVQLLGQVYEAHPADSVADSLNRLRELVDGLVRGSKAVG